MSDIFNQPAVVCADCGRALYGTEVCHHEPGHVIGYARKRAEEAADYPKPGWHGEVLHAAVQEQLDGAGDVEALRRRLQVVTCHHDETDMEHVCSACVLVHIEPLLAADRAAAERRGAEKALREAADDADAAIDVNEDTGAWLRARANRIGGTR